MMMMIHVGYRMTARGKEFDTRNIFYSSKHVSLHSEYSKSRSITQANRGVSRFLDKKASKVLLYDILVIRTLVCSVASFIQKNEKTVQH